MANNDLKLAVLAGDGIGPEITHATVRVLEAAADRAGLSLALSNALVGWKAYEKTKSTLPEETIDILRSHQGWIVGPLSQFRARASRRAVDVLPTPLGPVRRYADATRPSLIALARVRDTASCPMRSEKKRGRHLRGRERKVMKLALLTKDSAALSREKTNQEPLRGTLASLRLPDAVETKRVRTPGGRR